MLRRMLRATEWGQLFDFVSPSFFDVVPARSLAGAVKDLLSSTRDAAGFRRIAAGLEARLAARGLPLVLSLDAAEPSQPPPASAVDRALRGQLVLRLYFEQILGADAAILDLRGSRFARRGDGFVWSPAHGTVRWDPAFLESIREMYRSFYAGRDAEFRAALAALRLTAAEDVFREHFGTGEQRAVRFEMAHFTRSFHAVFVRCRDAGERLHPNFVALGVHLASLYEHLEPLGVELDVRRAFATATA